MSKKILPMNLADFMISGKFGENYSKVLKSYFNTNFSYDAFEITDNGIITTIHLTVIVDEHILVPLVFEFQKNYLSNNEIKLTIRCMYEKFFNELHFSYKTYIEFLDVFENDLIENDELIKLYI